MSATYTPGASDKDRVRALIRDTRGANPADPDVADPLFSDEELADWLLTEGHVKLAAAQALDTIGSSEVLTLKVMERQGLRTDGAKVSAELRGRASALRAQVAEERKAAADEAAFDWASMAGFSW